MIEVTGNLWTYPAGDARVITTNGTVKKNGECVMGRGCALEAKQHWPELPKALGNLIKERGNIVSHIPTYVGINNLWAFPVKHNWNEKADIDLIKRSALQLVEIMDDLGAGFRVIVLPRPGCGNGGLRWCYCTDLAAVGGRALSPDNTQCYGVKHILAPILDDRFHVITWGGK